MEKIKSFFTKTGLLNFMGLISLAVTLYLGSAGTAVFLLCGSMIALLEYLFGFLKKGRLSPYLLMLLSPLLLIYYSSITDFNIRVLSFLMLAYIVTSARTHPVKKRLLPFRAVGLEKTKPVLVWLIAFVFLSCAALVVYSQGVHLSGDEPHYIMITQSITEDGDFDLKNNMEEKTYFKYLPVEIRFHGGDYQGKYYSFHTPGISFLLIPFYWLFGLVGGFVPPQLFFRLAAAVINAFFILCLFLLLKRTFPGKNITWFWLLFLVLFPFAFHCIHLYPELPAAALLMAGFMFAFPGGGARHYLFSGLFLSLIPWFHIKYSPVLVLFALIVFFKLIKKKSEKSFVKPFFSFLVFPVFSFVLLLLYTNSLYGSFNPANIFPSEGYFSVPILARVKTLFSYFFDQRDGLLFYSPLFFLAFFGWRRKFSGRGILLGMAASYVLLHANTTLRGAYSPAGRPLMFVSWIFVILIVNYYFSLKEAGNQKPAYLFKFLSGLSFFVLAWLFFYPLFVYQPVFAHTTERASGLLTFFSSSYTNLPLLFPSFLSSPNWGYVANYVWLGIFGLLLLGHYLFSMKAEIPQRRPLLGFLTGTGRGHSPGAKIISFLLFLILAFLLCFYPHVHLISKNKFTGKKISFYNNSRNFYYIEDRDVFRIKAGNRYDIYIDLKGKNADSVSFHFLNPDAAAVKVRNGGSLLFDSRRQAESRFSFKLPALRKLKIKGKQVVHVGFETGTPADRERPFLFLKIE